jgi:hypothetical protein
LGPDSVRQDLAITTTDSVVVINAYDEEVEKAFGYTGTDPDLCEDLPDSPVAYNNFTISTNIVS